MKLVEVLNILLLIAIQVNSSILYLSLAVQNTTFYQCFSKGGNTKITLGITQANGTNTINNTFIQNIKTAKSFGLSVEGIITPCRNRTVEQNVQIIASAFSEKLIDRFWIEIPDGTSACGWGNYPAATNCQYLQELIMRMKQKFLVDVSIFTSKVLWIDIFKDQLGCPQVSNTLLWWTPDTLPSPADLSNYTKIGGWDRPYAKLYGVTGLCSTFIFASYYEA